mmetsp:Transcript_131942/g.381581  ORF Transcript_131942/g.381581 Transcript_131942/m.381581 type:complete len:368 (+) Transcript_131942:502-1605(+)
MGFAAEGSEEGCVDGTSRLHQGLERFPPRGARPQWRRNHSKGQRLRRQNQIRSGRGSVGDRALEEGRELREAPAVVPVAGGVEHELLAQRQGGRLEVCVAWQPAGVRDREGQAFAGRVLEEDAVQGFAQQGDATPLGREVAHTGDQERAGASALDLADRLQHLRGGSGGHHPAIEVRLGSDRRDCAIEEDVLGRKVELRAQQPVAPLADTDAVLERRRRLLALHSHDDDCGAIAQASPSQAEKLLLALRQGDRVHDALAWAILQALLNHRPGGGAKHHRDSSDCPIRRAQAQKLPHRPLAVHLFGVEVDVQDTRARLDLPGADLESGTPIAAPLCVLVRQGERPEVRRAGDAATLADYLQAVLGSHR